MLGQFEIKRGLLKSINEDKFLAHDRIYLRLLRVAREETVDVLTKIFVSFLNYRRCPGGPE